MLNQRVALMAGLMLLAPLAARADGPVTHPPSWTDNLGKISAEQVTMVNAILREHGSDQQISAPVLDDKSLKALSFEGKGADGLVAFIASYQALTGKDGATLVTYPDE